MDFSIDPRSQAIPVRKMMVFIDGENIVSRFEAMKEKFEISEHTYKQNSFHEENIVFWSPLLLPCVGMHEVIRCTLYTSATGDEDFIYGLEIQIKGLTYNRHQNSKVPNCILPRVFKKSRRNDKSKGVDMNICIDSLLHAASGHYDTAVFLTGDGDFLPLIKTIQSLGKQCYVGSFSEGCHPQMKIVPDYYFCLDDPFFGQEKRLIRTIG